MTLNEPCPAAVLTEFLAIPGLRPRTGRPGSSGPTLPRHSWSIRPRATSPHTTQSATTGIRRRQPLASPRRLLGSPTNMVPARPANPVSPLDVEAAERGVEQLLQQLVPERGDQRMGRRELGRHPDRPTRCTRRLRRQGRLHGCAVLPTRVAADAGLRRWPAVFLGIPFLKGLPVRCAAESPTCSDFNQPTDPGGFREVLEGRGVIQVRRRHAGTAVGHRERNRRRERLEAAVLHRQPHRGGAGPGRTRRGYPRLHVLVVRGQPRVGQRISPRVWFLHRAPTRRHRSSERTPKPASISAIKQIATGNELPTGGGGGCTSRPRSRMAGRRDCRGVPVERPHLGDASVVDADGLQDQKSNPAAGGAGTSVGRWVSTTAVPERGEEFLLDNLEFLPRLAHGHEEPLHAVMPAPNPAVGQRFGLMQPTTSGAKNGASGPKLAVPGPPAARYSTFGGIQSPATR